MKSDRYIQFFLNSKKKHQLTDTDQKKTVCYYCGLTSKTIFVHGHEQCEECRTNVTPCCDGEVAKY